MPDQYKWIYTKRTGQLYMKKTLLTFDIPVLFLCTDEQEHLFLCLNIDIDTGLTVIAETSKQMLEDMEQCRIPMETVFREAEEERLILIRYDKVEKKIEHKIENAKEIPEDMLPERDAFLA